MGLFNKLFGREKKNPKDLFAEQLIALISEMGETQPLDYDAERFCIRATTGQNHFLNLDNIYAEYLQVEASDRPEHLRNLARLWFAYRHEIPKDIEDVGCDLLPQLRTRSYYENALLQARITSDKNEEPDPIPHQIIGEHFGLGLVYDLPHSMQSINDDTLAEWGITLYEGLERATQNLAEMEIQVGFLHIEAEKGTSPGDLEGGLYTFVSGDCYDASRILLTDRIRATNLLGEPVAMMPNRNLMLLTGTDDDFGLQAMTRIAESTLREEPRPMSGIALRLAADNAWEVWMPEPSHPLFAKFNELKVMTLAYDYSGQKQMLEELFEKELRDVFVASYSAIGDDAGNVFSYCVWPKDVPTLIPRTDFVMLMPSQKGPPYEVPWETLFETLADEPQSLPRQLDYYPPRFEVGEFPTGAAWERLRKVATKR